MAEHYGVPSCHVARCTVVTTVWKFNGNIFPSKRSMFVNLEVRPNMLVTLTELSVGATQRMCLLLQILFVLIEKFLIVDKVSCS